ADRLLRDAPPVPRHPRLHPRRHGHPPRYIRRPEVELRPIPVERRRVPPPLLLRQHVHLGLDLRVRRDRLGLRQHHPPLHLFLLRPPQEHPDVIPRLPLIEHLAEHLHPRHHRALRGAQAHDLHLVPHLHDHPLPAPRHHRAPPADRKHSLDRHHTRAAPRPLPRRNVRAHPLH